MIDLIRHPVQKDFVTFRKALEEALSSGNIVLSEVSKYLEKSKGKELRPTMVLLSAAMFGPVPDAAIKVAVAVELLHTASLLHDDVVDDSDKRHSKLTINALWQNKIAILSGDYYLANSLNIVSEIGNNLLVSELSKLGSSLADGELLQLHCAKLFSADEDIYYDIIRMKTAKTFSFSSFAGAIAAGVGEEALQKMKSFGENLGMSFQIRDDIFDYFETTEKTGKPMGNDLREGKITLPLIYALKNADESVVNDCKKWLTENPISKDAVETLYRFAKENGGIEYAQQKMEEYRQKAFRDLADFPDTPAKQSLLLCLDYTISRSF